MNARRDAFQEQYGHVWAQGESGIKIGHMVVPDRNTADSLIEHLFFNNLIADARRVPDGISRAYVRHGHEVTEDGEQKLIFVTDEDRMDEMVKTIGEHMHNHLFDLVFVPVATGHRQYIEWDKDQTITNEGAEKEMTDD